MNLSWKEKNHCFSLGIWPKSCTSGTFLAMKLNYYELRNTKRHILFHAPKTICSDVITTHTEMRYCCCILSPQTIYTLSQFFHLSLENDVTATLKRFLKPFLLTFILKWILIQFCPKKSRSKTNKWHPQSVNTGFHIILRQVFRLAIKTITGKHFSCNMGQSWQFRRITLSKQKSVWGHCEDCCKPPIFFKKPFSDNSITIFQNYLYLNGHYVFLRLCTNGPYKWSRQLLPML